MNVATQLVILSGKGGTGKTSFTASFAHLASDTNLQGPNILVDADVDAANLSLLLDPQNEMLNDFWGGSLAFINSDLCIGCGDCAEVCRYDALGPDPKDESVYLVDPIACDGCAACFYACPQHAISMIKQQEGIWFEADTQWGKLYHAELFPGGENSGKLVTLLRQKAKLKADETGSSLIIIDGPPGIGCPVISACSGVDLGLIVTEPSMAGLHDLKRVFGVLKHFKIPVLVCINKADIYPEGTRQIYAFAEQENITIIGEVPFDEHFPQALLQGQPVTLTYPECDSSKAIRSVLYQVLKFMHA